MFKLKSQCLLDTRTHYIVICNLSVGWLMKEFLMQKCCCDLHKHRGDSFPVDTHWHPPSILMEKLQSQRWLEEPGTKSTRLSSRHLKPKVSISALMNIVLWLCLTGQQTFWPKLHREPIEYCKRRWKTLQMSWRSPLNKPGILNTSVPLCYISVLKIFSFSLV